MTRKIRAAAVFGLTLLSASLAFGQAQAPAPAAGGGGGAAAAAPFVLATTAFPDGGDWPVRFTQAGPGVAPGEGTSPALTWTGTPAGTRSFVLHMHDMEVVRNKGTDDQLHWLVWNIPATATGLAEGQPRGATLPDGSKQISATGPVYRGPGAGANGPKHHYVIEIYALDNVPAVDATDDAFATRTKVFEAMQGHILNKAVYLGLFRRPN